MATASGRPAVPVTPGAVNDLAAPERPPRPPAPALLDGGGLREWLLREPYRFRFFQAVRLLQLLFLGRQPVGQRYGAPGLEVVRFRARLSLSFPPSEVYDLGWAKTPLDYAGEPGP